MFCQLERARRPPTSDQHAWFSTTAVRSVLVDDCSSSVYSTKSLSVIRRHVLKSAAEACWSIEEDVEVTSPPRRDHGFEAGQATRVSRSPQPAIAVGASCGWFLHLRRLALRAPVPRGDLQQSLQTGLRSLPTCVLVVLLFSVSSQPSRRYLLSASNSPSKTRTAETTSTRAGNGRRSMTPHTAASTTLTRVTASPTI